MRTLSLVLCALTLSALGLGQSNYAVVSGTVKDSQSLPVVHASVTFKALSVKVSDRHFGIGGDGLILVAPPTNSAKAAGPEITAAIKNREHIPLLQYPCFNIEHRRSDTEYST